MDEEMEYEAQPEAQPETQDENLTQEEANRLEAQRALELWAEHCELNQGQELYEPAEGDFDYEAISDCDEEYEVERYAYAGDESDSEEATK